MIIHTLPTDAWQTVAWLEGPKGPIGEMLPRVRVFRTVARGRNLDSEGWLLVERPLPNHVGDRTLYFAQGLDERRFAELVDIPHILWVVERFYRDAEDELGLDDYEGRLWHGLHRHLALVMLARSVLILRQTYGGKITERGPPPEEREEECPPSPPPVGGFSPVGRPSIAALGRRVHEEPLLQVLAMLGLRRSRDGQ